MPYQTGITQTGLPSEQQPTIPAITLGPIGTAGLSVVGDPAADGIKTFGFAVNGRIMQHTVTNYMCMVRLSLTKYMRLMVAASVYSPNMTVRTQIQGSIVSGSINVYTAKGLLRIAQTCLVSAMGAVVRQKNARLKATGILQSTHDIVYRAQGVLEAYQRTALQVTGLIRAICVSKVVIWGRISGNYAKVIRAAGAIGLSADSFCKATGLLQQSAAAIYRVAGQMQTAIETRFLQIIGRISVPQFIAAVPRRMQDWVTNKRWWR